MKKSDIIHFAMSNEGAFPPIDTCLCQRTNCSCESKKCRQLVRYDNPCTCDRKPPPVYGMGDHVIFQARFIHQWHQGIIYNIKWCEEEYSYFIRAKVHGGYWFSEDKIAPTTSPIYHSILSMHHTQPTSQ